MANGRGIDEDDIMLFWGWAFRYTRKISEMTTRISVPAAFLCVTCRYGEDD
jgi:hypothetical protein